MGTVRNYYSLFVVLGAAGLACHSPEQCPDPGELRACECVEGRSGQQRCLPERVWDHCVCAGNDGGLADAAPAPMAPADADDPAPPGDGAVPPGSGADAAAGDKDAAVPPVDADSGVPDAGVDAGSDAGAPQDAGGQDAAPPGPGPYAACAVDGDCASGAICGLYTAFPIGPMFSACAPACSATQPCPTPSGSFTAMPLCGLDERCRIDCTATGFPPTQGTCPPGMQCQMVDAFGTYCVHP